MEIIWNTTEIDAQCQRLPPNHNICHFMKGITSLSRVSGQEHRDICKILLGLIADLPLPGIFSLYFSLTSLLT